MAGFRDARVSQTVRCATQLSITRNWLVLIGMLAVVCRQEVSCSTSVSFGNRTMGGRQGLEP